MIRPTTSMGMFWAAQMMVEPINLVFCISVYATSISMMGKSLIPDESADLNRALATQVIRDETRDERAEPGTTSH